MGQPTGAAHGAPGEVVCQALSRTAVPAACRRRPCWRPGAGLAHSSQTEQVVSPQERQPPGGRDQSPLHPPAERQTAEQVGHQQHRPQQHRVDELCGEGTQQPHGPGTEEPAPAVSERRCQHGGRCQQQQEQRQDRRAQQPQREPPEPASVGSEQHSSFPLSHLGHLLQRLVSPPGACRDKPGPASFRPLRSAWLCCRHTWMSSSPPPTPPSQ